ncbi:MurR/RpiR family transcriptional regulator [Falseniella ignava]|uniref:HTH rpiR-type domain-containing protein n=1 Tax=Falseniella ignava CCUG 37419 TaxID=883112 RepID=K1LI59_9LACT|nr:MurR/RpiR family transcriptional regulator [Falseniella ignava]EKB54296.1 hypothetical protein HMPREF9707_01224 [Falseniella ignava CCUG 37419]
MSILSVRLREHHIEATQTEKVIIDYILSSLDSMPELTIYQLAEQTFASPASISRLCKKLGFKGYSDFQKAVIYEQASRNTYLEGRVIDFAKNSTIEEIMDGMISRNILGMEELKQLMSEESILKTVELIEASNNLSFFGMGASLIVAMDAQMKFIRGNKMAMVNQDWHSQLLVARNMKRGDLAFTISYSGETEEMVEVTRAAKSNGAKIITLTNQDNSTIANLADVNLFIPSNELPLRSAATVSRLMQLNYIDVIFQTYLSRSEDSIEILERTRINKLSEGGDRI